MPYAWTGIYMLGTKTYRTAEMVRGTEKEGDLSYTEVNMLKVFLPAAKRAPQEPKQTPLGKYLQLEQQSSSSLYASADKYPRMTKTKLN